MKTDVGIPKRQRNQARMMRRTPTEAERRLWRLLRDRRLCDLKFRRQAPLGPYIVEFMCFERKLILEVDGSQHFESARDQGRDHWLKTQGWTVLRFWNNDILQRSDAVLQAVLAQMGLPC